MKKTLTISFIMTFLIGINFATSQDTGIFQTTISFNGSDRILEYSVPTDYDVSETYPLIVGLHGCVGGTNPASDFRDNMAFLSDSINAIIVCPNGLSNQNGYMGGTDNGVIEEALNHALANYAISTDSVYLTGFSCNGYTTASFGTQGTIYNWAGIIPFHAGIIASDFTDNSIHFDNTTNTCICVGSLDQGLAENQRFRDSLASNGSSYYYNEIPGVGHTLNFPTLNEEVMECFDFFRNDQTNAVHQNEALARIEIYPNPATKFIHITGQKVNSSIQISTLEGKIVLTNHISHDNEKINISNLKNGIYLWELNNENGKKQAGKLIVNN